MISMPFARWAELSSRVRVVFLGGLATSLLLCFAFTMSRPILAASRRLPAAQRVSEQDLVSLSLKNVELLKIAELLVYERGINLVAPPDLNRKVTVRLNRVHWREALAVIFQQQGYGYEQIGNIIRIDTLENLKRSPARQQYRVENLDRPQIESLLQSVLTTPSSFRILDEPAPDGRVRARVVVVAATTPEQHQVAAMLARYDQPPAEQVLQISPVSPNGRISLSFHNLPLEDAMAVLKERFLLNMIHETRLSGRVDIDLDEVTLTEALEAILGPAGYAFELTDRTLRVGEASRFKPHIRIRMFTLKYANATHVKALVQPHLSPTGKVEVVGEVPDPGDPPKKPGGMESSPPGSVPPATAPPAYLAPPKPATEPELPRVPPSNQVVVTDTPAVLAQIEALVTAVDLPPQQVSIQAKLVEVTTEKDEQLGIRWDVALNANGASGQYVKVPFDRNKIHQAGVPDTFTLGTLSAADFSLFLKAFSQRRKLKVLSSPTISTVSNQPARILVGQRFPITVQTLQQTTAFQTNSLQYYEDIGIALTVTPRIVADGQVNLIVKPQVSSVASLIDNRFPVIDTRQVETQLVLKAGDTAVIGGLLQERKEKTAEGLPALAHLPVIGRLFGGHRFVRRQTELLICVTPHIMSSFQPALPMSR